MIGRTTLGTPLVPAMASESGIGMVGKARFWLNQATFERQ